MKKWELVFPPADREIYEKAGMGYRETFGQRPAFLIIDVVLSFTGSKPEAVLRSIEEFRTSCGEAAWKAISSIQELLEACRSMEIPVVYVRGDANNKGFCGDSIKGVTLEDVAKFHSQDFPEAIAPRPTEFVLKKTKASAFFATPLAVYLHRLGIDSLLVAGTSTSGCVRASVVDAYSHGYKVFLVEECCFDRSEFSHLVNLYEMNAKYANVTTLPEALDYLQQLKAPGRLAASSSHRS